MDKIIKKDIVNGVEYKYNGIGGGGSITDNNVIYISQADYDNLTPAEKADTTKNYVIIGQGSIPVPTEIDAEDVNFDNTGTSMQSDNVQDAIEEVFQSVSNGKTLIAAAITDKGVSTAASDSFQTMADNIESLTVGGKYTEGSSGDVLLYNYRGYEGNYINVCSSSEQTENLDSVYYYTCLFRISNENHGGIVVKYNNTTKKIYKTGITVTVINTPNDQLKFYKDGNKVWLACVYTGSSPREKLFGYFDETNTFTVGSSGISEKVDITANSGYIYAPNGGMSTVSLGTATFIGAYSPTIDYYDHTGICCVA